MVYIKPDLQLYSFGVADLKETVLTLTGVKGKW
jgi:hypothetical protein